MATIVNPRGAGGSGKSELVRRIMVDLGWREQPVTEGVEIIRREGRPQPLGYRFHSSPGRRAIAVLGHYERRSGGCDTISLAHGGLDEVFARAEAHADAGDDVLLEGLRLSSEVERTRAVAGRHEVHIVALATPPEVCVRHLMARRRTGERSRARMEQVAAAEHGEIAAALDALRPCAAVEVLAFEGALAHVRRLLRISPREAAPSVSPGLSAGS